ncbi:hypothetical protein C8034_v003410 [Colletotrichum sidae]|uniref:Uncharacterized protein n=1 Tax=Colletotrichum sidae TaxID=1347389 RepID=A0A4R8SB10_9PEZI|nr:hypothetical protein C8034_v003410 [Colletotrichum sidae]
MIPAIDTKESNGLRLADYSIIILLIIIIIRIPLAIITIFNPYNLNININLIKVINNYKNYNYFYKGLKGLALYKDDFIILSSPLKVIIATFSLNILLEDKVVSRVKKNKIKVIKKNLASKSRMFKNNKL